MMMYSKLKYSLSLLLSFSVGQRGKIYWRNNWVTFLDGFLQITFLDSLSRDLLEPITLQKLTINSKLHTAQVQKLGANNKDVGESVPFSLNEIV
jgi:hypothetical protein